MFGNKVLRIFGPRRDEVTGEWRRLHNEELNDLYGCETWSLTLREERRLRVFENMVLRIIIKHCVEEDIWTQEGRVSCLIHILYTGCVKI